MQKNSTSADELAKDLSQFIPVTQIFRDEPMAQHCTFRTGGNADLFIRVNRTEELRSALSVLRHAGEPYFLLGRGSNVLVSDSGYRGAIVTMVPETGKDNGFSRIEVLEDTAEQQESGSSGETEKTDTAAAGNDADRGYRRIRAGAGAFLSALSFAARDHSLTGLEFACGIPGSVGGGLRMNAGAYGGEIRQTVESAELLLPDGTIRNFSGEEMQFGYRTSILKTDGVAALGAIFRLLPGNREEIQAKIDDYSARRRSKQPLEYPSAGSTFKRPEGHFAGQLIGEAGLRGFRIGNAGISEKHCGFVINYGGASASEVYSVIREVQRRVYGNSGVKLEPEVILLGEFAEEPGREA